VALCHFLTVQTGEDPEAWIGRDAIRWAQAKDSETLVEAATELKTILGALDEAAYHSGAAPDRSSILKAAQKFAKQVAA